MGGVVGCMKLKLAAKMNALQGLHIAGFEFDICKLLVLWCIRMYNTIGYLL